MSEEVNVKGDYSDQRSPGECAESGRGGGDRTHRRVCLRAALFALFVKMWTHATHTVPSLAAVDVCVSLLSLTVLGVPQDTKAELGAAFGHLVPKMSGFVHVDSV